MKLHYSELRGLEYNPNITRRDPSPVIKYNDTYYIYYSKTSSISGYDASIWCAESTDGLNWVEIGEIIPKGNPGSFDSGGTFTPTVFKANNYIYIIYTAVSDNFDVKSIEDNGLTAFGMVRSKYAHKEFEKIYTEPFFQTRSAEYFDSHRVDDACIIHKDNKYYMYYKGRQIGLTPKETKMGLAIAENPEGPYIRSQDDPVQDSGHEVCVYPSNGGILSLTTDTGPQGNSILFSEDGFNFKKIGDLVIPQSLGPYRDDDFINNASCNFNWGVCHADKDERPYLLRVDVEYSD